MVDKPDLAWVSDISYIWTNEGWLYLAVVIDLFSRQVVGWSVDKRITKKLVMDAFRMAVGRRRPVPGLLFHSDRGRQYCSRDFQKLLKATAGTMRWLRASLPVSQKDRVYCTGYKTREEARRDIVDYLEMFYNAGRLHSSPGYVSPRQFEEAWLLANAS